jgi:Tol biopolymer transport system component
MATQAFSDIAIYDVASQEVWLLPGADRPDRLEIYPRWTLDGKALVFCSAPAGQHPARMAYDLNIIPYNDGAGGTPRPIPGASGNGRSNYYPRFSPDGRWLSFCQCDGGDLIRPSSDIYLLPASLEGEAHRLESNDPYAADSWHSWSSNSRWLVFASKRDDGVYARLYLTEIDEQGHASPAVRLPIREDPLKSFNIPESLAADPQVSERDLYEAIRVQQPTRKTTDAKPPHRG